MIDAVDSAAALARGAGAGAAQMFSTSMIASSTTTPTAITKPGQDHRVDRRRRAGRAPAPAATSESGIATRLISAVRHSNRKATRTSTTSRQPRSSALREVVERDLDEGRRPEDRGVDLDARQAGPQLLERLLDAAGHLERVGPRELLDDQQQARAVVDDRVADQRLVVHRPRRPRRRGAAACRRARSIVTWPGRPASTIGRTCRTPSRWLGVSMNPPVPIDRARRSSCSSPRPGRRRWPP